MLHGADAICICITDFTFSLRYVYLFMLTYFQPFQDILCAVEVIYHMKRKEMRNLT